MKTGFENKTTEELVNAYVLTDREDIFCELLKRTENLRYKLARNYLNIPGSELEDLVSEGMMEMFKATKKFDSTKGSFTTFIYSAISRRYNTLFTLATNEKHLGESYTESFDKLQSNIKSNESSENYRNYGSITFSVECPEYGIIEMMDVIERANLSDQEHVTIQLILRGNTKAEIAEFLHVKAPTVHSYLRRVYNKLRLAIA